MSRVVVISGGGTGIGRATAELFARAGDRVVLVGRRADPLKRTADEITETLARHGAGDDPHGAGAGTSTGSGAGAGAGAEVTTVVADLSETAGARHVRDVVREQFGRVDVLVNSAGGNAAFGSPAGDGDPLDETAEHWLGNFRSNVLTAVLLTEALRDLLASPGGRVVLVSSIAAYRGSGSGSYGASKAALHPYTYDLAAALGPRGITVNAVAPGYVADTEFFRDTLAPERERTLVGQTLNGRAGVPDDVARTVRWLAAPESSHVTAQIVQVNGGAERGR
ncbi:SDR family NAD(P)-dependent oxidoreductase [Streptomyces sp. NPDC091368]|uniref:SDR family NAD(P)-dependent oxidoreductase n=1 Tax=Streptomyces sp. NPDC091368 TaxID=3365993 RepID=UPI0037F90963